MPWTSGQLLLYRMLKEKIQILGGIYNNFRFQITKSGTLVCLTGWVAILISS